MSEILERMKLAVGDITNLTVDAVVTAANEALCGGGGVDGAIHRAAGPALLVEECPKIGHCPPGEARITRGYLLPAKYIIHTVGPVWEDGRQGEAETLKSCYRRSLQLAAEHGVSTIAFPCVATGVYGYPKEEACELAVSVALAWLRENEMPRQIVFCCFDETDARLYRARLPQGS